MNACRLPETDCTFCKRRAGRRILFVQERGAGIRPYYQAVRLPVCEHHLDPFSRDESGMVPEVVYAKSRTGWRIALVGLAETFRLRYLPEVRALRA